WRRAPGRRCVTAWCCPRCRTSPKSWPRSEPSTSISHWLLTRRNWSSRRRTLPSTNWKKILRGSGKGYPSGNGVCRPFMPHNNHLNHHRSTLLIVDDQEENLRVVGTV